MTIKQKVFQKVGNTKGPIPRKKLLDFIFNAQGSSREEKIENEINPDSNYSTTITQWVYSGLLNRENGKYSLSRSGKTYARFGRSFISQLAKENHLLKIEVEDLRERLDPSNDWKMKYNQLVYQIQYLLRKP